MTKSVLETDLARAHRQIIGLQAANERCADDNARLRTENIKLKAKLDEQEILWERFQQAHPSESS